MTTHFGRVWLDGIGMKTEQKLKRTETEKTEPKIENVSVSVSILLIVDLVYNGLQPMGLI